MTDLIHEEPKKTAPQEKKPEISPMKAEKEGMHRFSVYSAILLIAALALIALSFFANNRSDREVMDKLQLMQGSIEQNATEQGELDRLRKQNDRLEEDLRESEKERELQRLQLCALDGLREIESAYAAGKKDEAREKIRSFEKEDLSDYLPAISPRAEAFSDEAESPADAYARISDELFPDGIR